MPRELGDQPCRKASKLCTATHQRIFTGNTQQSILMLKSRLKFQFQVNSKFTNEDIFSQVAVSLFILLSCSQVNSLPQIIKPSVMLRGCTIGHTLENTPGPQRGRWTPSLPPASHLHTIQSPRAATLLWAFLQSGPTEPGPLCLQGCQPSFGREGTQESPNPIALSPRGEHCVYFPRD